MAEPDFGIQWYLENTLDHEVEFYPFNTVHPVSIQAHTMLPIHNIHEPGKLDHYRELREIGLFLRKQIMQEYITKVEEVPSTPAEPVETAKEVDLGEDISSSLAKTLPTGRKRSPKK